MTRFTCSCATLHENESVRPKHVCTHSSDTFGPSLIQHNELGVFRNYHIPVEYTRLLNRLERINSWEISLAECNSGTIQK